MKPLIVKRAQPRNPLVGPALMRRAGSHRRSQRTERQSAERTLRAELTDPPLRGR